MYIRHWRVYVAGLVIGIVISLGQVGDHFLAPMRVYGRADFYTQANGSMYVPQRAVQPGVTTATITPTTQLSFTNQTIGANVAITHATITKTEMDLAISGAAAGDFNRDGWQDLFVAGGGARPDALFINQGNGTFAEESKAWGVGVQQRSAGVAVGDYDNDGWLDIFVTTHGLTQTMAAGHHRLYHNNQNGTFTDMAQMAGVNRSSPLWPDGFGATFGDYDLDGYLDLFVTGWQPGDDGNRLYHNNRNGTFTDVTDIAGDFNTGLRGFSPCFVDMNGDRYPELLVSGDYSTSRYYINNRNGAFTEQSGPAGVRVPMFGMGSAIGDFNHDGLFDWYITSIYQPDSFGGAGNHLFINQGNHRFIDQAVAAGVDNGGWGWGTIGVDLNHDGWLDIVETNGWSLQLPFYNQPARVWLNQDGQHFTEAASAVGLNYRQSGRGLLNFDYDNDGDQDIVITSNNDKLALFRNDLAGPATNWLRVFLDTSHAPNLAPNGIGARIQIRVGNALYVQTIKACSNYLSQSELSAHFGLGRATLVDEVRVEWSDGQVTSLTNVPANQTLTLSPLARLHLPIISAGKLHP